ncbi:MAG: murein biosynthesis integral membrane protein MurJ [Myxococcales bacterium]|nr:murein biosynthesis integral membrane protein MurJ [Myxococcales bacterium]
MAEEAASEEPSGEPDGAAEAAGERAAIAGRAGLVGLGTLSSRALGLGRDLALAALFPRAATDLFFVAFTIPNALRQLLAEGALSSAFVPVLAGVDEKEGKEAAERFYAKLRGAMWLVLIVTCAVGVMAAPLLCELFAAGFHARPGAFERTVAITRAVFPYLLFMGLAALGAGALQTRKRFGVAAFAPGLLNVAMIVCAFALAPVLSRHGIDPLYALAVGALIGGALQVAAQAPDLRRAGFGGPLALDLSDPKVREVVRRIAPMAIGLMIYEVDLVLSRRFLSQAGEGANSFFYYAQRLCDFPQGVFALAIATATLPSLAKLVARGDRKEVAVTAAHAIRLSAYVGLPATTLLVALAGPITTVVFARGAFDAVSVDGTTRALVAQALGIWTVALVRQLVPIFHALGDTRTPVWVSLLDLFAFVALALGLRGRLGHVGVSVAVSGSSFVQMALLIHYLRQRLPELHGGLWVGSFLKNLTAAAFAGLAAFGAAQLSSGFLPVLGAVTPLVLGLVAFGGVFLALGYGLGSEEQRTIVSGLARRLRRRRA